MPASVIVPAHDEEAVIGRLLSELDGVLAQVLVVCNGCKDSTAAVARATMPAARVVELDGASKANALRIGQELAGPGRRVFVDADVEISSADVNRLLAALDEPGLLAVAPDRHLELEGASWPVRAYYSVWQELPVVRSGLFGRGVIAVSERARFEHQADVMGDDLVLSSTFPPPTSRIVTGATVTVHGPRTLVDLLRRRERAATGNHQLRERHRPGSEHPAPPKATTPAQLWRLLRSRPHLLPHTTVFIAVTLLARRRARRRISSGDFVTWQRDESSRAVG